MTRAFAILSLYFAGFACAPRVAVPSAVGRGVAPRVGEVTPGALRVARVCERLRCTFDAPPAESALGAGGVFVFELRVGARAEAILLTQGSPLAMGVVIEGAASLRGGEGMPALPLERWIAFRASGTDLRIRARDAGARAVIVWMRDTSVPPAVSASTKLLERVDLRTVAPSVWAKGAFRAHAAFEAAASPRASLGLLLSASDARVPLHTHDASLEIIALLDGRGTLVVHAAGAAPPVRREMSAGEVALVPSGRPHEWISAGTRPLAGVQIYVPAGPEARFRVLHERERAMERR
jgi:mannose-6-phosphate isomerase-like protein (cupin superfamily)